MTDHDPPPLGMRHLWRSALVISVVLILVVLPFLAFGQRIEAWVERMVGREAASHVVVAFIVAVLAADILLPVPSSVVSVMAGWEFGVAGGTVVSWTGMTLGAALGFALARLGGRAFALRFAGADDLATMQRSSERYGPWLLVLARGVPVLAEASILLVGIHQMAWRKFLPPVLLANLGISFAYCAFGQFAARHQWLPLALGVSVALPVLLAALVRRFVK